MNDPTTVWRAAKRRRNDEKCGLTTSPDTVAPPPAICTGRLQKAGSDVALGETIAGSTPIGHSYSQAFHQVEFRYAVEIRHR
jgi:hypothetical protein